MCREPATIGLVELGRHGEPVELRVTVTQPSQTDLEDGLLERQQHTVATPRHNRSIGPR